MRQDRLFVARWQLAVGADRRGILHLLAGRLSLQEIAAESFISVNTLKFHLKAIYRKLGVHSRAEAAEATRRSTMFPSARERHHLPLPAPPVG